MGKRHNTPLESFWFRANKAETGCWLWSGAINPVNGYGVLRVNNRVITAHRYSWELYNGTIPDGLLVCHTCDVRQCCNPDHLFLGTQADNMRDMDTKGRGRMRGERHGNAKITADIVREIRALGDNRSEPQTKIASRYNISRSAVMMIITRRRWAHIT